MRTWVPLTVASLVYVVALLWSAGQLPADGVPLHFGAGGVADRFGTWTEAVAGLAVIGAGMVLLAFGLQVLARRMPVHAMNIPHREHWVTPEREPRLRRMLAEDFAYFMTAVLVFLASVPLGTAYAVHQDPPAIPGWVFWLELVALLGFIGVRLLHMTRSRYAPPEGADRD